MSRLYSFLDYDYDYDYDNDHDDLRSFIWRSCSVWEHMRNARDALAFYSF